MTKLTRMCAFAFQLAVLCSPLLATEKFQIDCTEPVSNEYDERSTAVVLVIGSLEKRCPLANDTVACTYSLPEHSLLTKVTVKLAHPAEEVFGKQDISYEPLKFVLTPDKAAQPLNIRIAPANTKHDNRALLAMAAERWINNKNPDERSLQAFYQRARAAWVAQRRRIDGGAREDDYTIKAAFLLVQVSVKLIEAVPVFQPNEDLEVKKAAVYLLSKETQRLDRALGKGNGQHAMEAAERVEAASAAPLQSAWTYIRGVPPANRFLLYLQYEDQFLDRISDTPSGDAVVAKLGVSLPRIYEAEANSLKADAVCGRMNRIDFNSHATQLLNKMQVRIYREAAEKQPKEVDDVCTSPDVREPTASGKPNVVLSLCTRYHELKRLRESSRIELKCGETV